MSLFKSAPTHEHRWLFIDRVGCLKIFVCTGCGQGKYLVAQDAFEAAKERERQATAELMKP